MWAVLDCSRGLCERSWDAIRAYVGGLGRYPGLRGQSWEGIRSKSGPNPSEKAFRGRGWKTRADRAPEPRTHFFSVYIYIYVYTHTPILYIHNIM